MGSPGQPLGGLLEAFLGPLGSLFGPLGAEGSTFGFVFPFLGLSWGRLGALSGHLVGLLGRRGASESRKGEKANIMLQWAINEFGFSGLSSPVYVCCVSVLYMLYFCTHVRLCACMYIRMHECMHVCMRMHVCVLVCMRVSTGLRPLPPPCLGGSEASCVFVGISW